MSAGDEIIIKDPAGKFKILRGGKFYDFTPPIKKTTVKVEQKLVDKILEKSGLRVAENLKSRFAEEIEAYSRDVRDKFETKSVLIRAVTSGGMGFTPEQADLVIKTIDELRKKEPPTGELPKAKAEPITPKAETGPGGKILPKSRAGKTAVPEMSKGVAELVFSPADEAEISAAEKKLPKISGGVKPAEISKIIGNILGESGIVLEPIDRKKLENILLTHFLDIRDSFEMRDTLSAMRGPGGLNLTEEQISKLLSVAKNKIGGREAERRGEAVALAEKGIEEEKLKANLAGEEVLKTVKSKIDERWQQITEKTDVAPIEVPAELIAPPAAIQAKISTIAPSRPAAVSEKQAAQVPVPEIGKKPLRLAGDIPLAIRGPVVPGEEPKPLEIFKTATSPARRPAAPPDNRPRLDDVKYVPKLVGPIEELREMTLIDFRRLDKNPEMATAKIKEKMRLLEKESITKKIAGIKAWQESEVSKLYLEISRESLMKGVPATQAISSRVSSGQPSLTEAEYQAIMSLARSLRY